jgi:tRNA dimethylallyltransferase
MDYIARIEPLVEEVRAGGRGICFVGGTALYVRMIVEGAFEGPAADHAIRDRLKAEAAERGGAPHLHKRLREIDPVAAGRIHENDLRRIVRALEVYELTGRPISELQAESRSVIEGLTRRIVVLQWPRDLLYRRIEERVDRMMASGWLDEVRELLETHGRLGPQARHALGYPELIDHIEGRCTLEEAVDRIKQYTRNFAKQQLTWFRNMKDALRIDIEEADTPETVAERIVGRLGD